MKTLLGLNWFKTFCPFFLELFLYRWIEIVFFIDLFYIPIDIETLKHFYKHILKFIIYAEANSEFLMLFVREENEHYFAQKIVLAKKEFLNNWYLIKRGGLWGEQKEKSRSFSVQINEIFSTK